MPWMVNITAASGAGFGDIWYYTAIKSGV